MKLIILYLGIGVLVNFIGPLAKKIREEITKIRVPSLGDSLSAKPQIPSWKKILYEVILRLLTVFMYPLLFIIIGIDYFRSKNQEQESQYCDSDANALYFSRIAGEGIINCNSCNHSQTIRGSLHGHGPNPWSSNGFQCQKCGKFHDVKSSEDNYTVKPCDCGGSLSRDKALFCPICKNTDLKYTMRFMC